MTIDYVVDVVQVDACMLSITISFRRFLSRLVMLYVQPWLCSIVAALVDSIVAGCVQIRRLRIVQAVWRPVIPVATEEAFHL